MIQEPSYHLEGVVHARDELEDFTGPLDLILMLLAKDKIEIRDIQISQLLDQYLAYLQKMQEMDLEIAEPSLSRWRRTSCTSKPKCS